VSVVFPLGMYGVAGQYLGRADELPFVKSIGADELWVALAAWLVVFVAMLHHLARTVVWRPATGGHAARRPTRQLG
jgi:tellurite resistance protein TehA-like permease